MVTTLLFVIGLALSISFLCSIMEAVLLSVSHSFVALMRRRDERAGAILTRLREHIDEPIAAILTLNTIAHTVGATVAGAIALEAFGDKWIALFSAVLTLAGPGVPSSSRIRRHDRSGSGTSLRTGPLACSARRGKGNRRGHEASALRPGQQAGGRSLNPAR